MNTPEPSFKCSHSGCRCQALPGERYCSEHCASLDDTFEVVCGCEHAPCSLTSTTTVQDEAGGELPSNIV